MAIPTAIPSSILDISILDVSILDRNLPSLQKNALPNGQDVSQGFLIGLEIATRA